MLQIIILRYEQSLKLSLIIMELDHGELLITSQVRVGVGDTIHPDPPHSQKILPSPRYNSDIEYHSKNSMITERIEAYAPPNTFFIMFLEKAFLAFSFC